MKRMIISPAQLKMINEAVAMFTYDNSSQNDFLSSLNRAKENNPGANVFHGYNASEAPKQQASTDDPDQASTAGEYIGNGDNGNNTTNTIGESRFSKRQVELGRMLEMRRTGKVFSKKQLNEMFMETQENADRLRNGIGNCRLKDIFDAIEEIFPEEVDGVKEAFMNGADLPEYICSIFSNDDINGEKEEAFLERLGI
jgi:hypothetical protein